MTYLANIFPPTRFKQKTIQTLQIDHDLINCNTSNSDLCFYYKTRVLLLNTSDAF